MNIFKDAIIALFISYEFFFLLMFTLLYGFWPNIFDCIQARITLTEHFIGWIALVPVCITVYVISNHEKLLSPEHENAVILNEWPNYRMMLMRYWITLFYCGLASLMGIIFWLISDDMQSKDILIILCAIAISLSSFICFHDAVITIKRILGSYKNCNS